MASGYRGGSFGGGRGGGNRRGQGGFKGDHQDRERSRQGSYGGRGGSGDRGNRDGGGRGGSFGGGQQVDKVFSNSQVQDPKVASVEDALHPATRNTIDPSSLKLTGGFPTRPGYGTRGKEVKLTANYVELLPPSKLVLYRYSIETNPEAVGRKHFRLMQLLLQSAELAPHQGSLVTDFRSTLISKTRLKCDDTIVEIPYRSDGEDEPRVGATNYKIRVLYNRTLDISQLIDYLNSTNLGQSFGDMHEFIQALNIFLNHHAKSATNLITIGSTKTFPLNVQVANQNGGSQRPVNDDLGHGLRVIRGFFSSVRCATSRILVNINVSHGAFYQHGPLLALMESHGISRTVALERFLKSVRIETTHLPEKRNKANEVIPRVKTIFGLATTNDGQGLDKAPQVKHHGAGSKDVRFWLDSEASTSGAPKAEAKGVGKDKDKAKGKAQPKSPAAPDSGGWITVFDYFKRTYNRDLQYPQLPLLNCGNRGSPMYLPAEVCMVLPGQPFKSNLDSEQTRKMIEYAVRKPSENMKSIILEGRRTVGLDANSNMLLRSFGIGVTPELLKVSGRILASPTIFYKGNKTVGQSFGTWNLKGLEFHTSGAPLAKWRYLRISLPGTRDAIANTLKTVMEQFHQVLRRHGVNAAPPLVHQDLLKLQHTDDPALSSMLRDAARDLKLLLIILPDTNIQLYKRIKTLADKDYGIHTVCCIGSKLAKGDPQYIANIALKFNLKLGGVNHLVRNLGIVEQDETMVVGIDVTHPSPGSTSNAPSVSAMVASIDKSLAQWPAVLRVQTARQENVDELGNMLKSRLHLWKTKHKALPRNILVYRDGVSEGQYDMVLSQELPQLRRACEEMYPAPDTRQGLPRFTIIICGKRHKTRFYPTTEYDCDKKGNTKPGTIVDRGVTEARNWDFFLQAHEAIQGTARPCHYYIVLDEIFRKRYANPTSHAFANVADIVEDLTHNMCYSFGRATKAVSLCPPAYYADLACERARCYFASLFDPPTPSATASGVSETGLGQVRNGDVQIHANLRDTMFYI